MTPLEITNEAVDRVRDNNLEYYNRVMAFAELWVKTKMKPFTSEDLKNDFYEVGNEQPRQPSVFGAVFRSLSKKGLIIKNGTSTAKNPIAHRRLLQVWISKEYSLKQQQNAIKDKSQLSIF